MSHPCVQKVDTPAIPQADPNPGTVPTHSGLCTELRIPRRHRFVLGRTVLLIDAAQGEMVSLSVAYFWKQSVNIVCPAFCRAAITPVGKMMFLKLSVAGKGFVVFSFQYVAV